MDSGIAASGIIQDCEMSVETRRHNNRHFDICRIRVCLILISAPPSRTGKKEHNAIMVKSAYKNISGMENVNSGITGGGIFSIIVSQKPVQAP